MILINSHPWGKLWFVIIFHNSHLSDPLELLRWVHLQHHRHNILVVFTDWIYQDHFTTKQNHFWEAIHLRKSLTLQSQPYLNAILFSLFLLLTKQTDTHFLNVLFGPSVWGMHDIAHYLGIPTNHQSLIRAFCVNANPPVTHHWLRDLSSLPEHVTIILKLTRIGGL